VATTPTVYQLRAALLAGRLVPESGCSVDSLRNSYPSVATGGMFRPDDLQAGESLLEKTELLRRSGQWVERTAPCAYVCALPDDVAVEVMLQLVLVADPPLWLFSAVVDDDVHWEQIPTQDALALGRALANAERREALLLQLGRRVHEDRNRALGLEGELWVEAACRQRLLEQGREDLAREVFRVSALSDQLGYDISSPDIAGHRHRIEVKAASGVGGMDSHVQFFISRNEARVGVADPGWSLVAVRKDVLSGQMSLLGWCRVEQFANELPTDNVEWISWASAKVNLAEAALSSGLPLA
jgi:hypothetical protein